MTPNELQMLFNHEIPVTNSMGLSVVQSTSDQVDILFGLKENKNHKGTAFGGSQYSACALACYGLFLVGIRERGFSTNNIVIAEGQIQYSKPVTENFMVSATWDSRSQEEFFEKLMRKKKSKVQLTAEVRASGQTCSKFSGFFVAILDESC